MAMNDEETVALIAGGHTFGKAHGAADRQQATLVLNPREQVSRSKASAGRIRFWNGQCRRHNHQRPRRGLERASPGESGHTCYLSTIYIAYEWELVEESGRCAWQWVPTEGGAGKGHRAGCSRPFEEVSHTNHVHDGPGAEERPEPMGRFRSDFFENPKEFAASLCQERGTS